MNCPNCLTLTQQLTELEALLAKGDCSCHIINPQKTRILMWKQVQDQLTTYQLKIGRQKFVSRQLWDKNNVTYWRYYSLAVQPDAKSAEVIPTEATLTLSEPDPIQKFQQRQAKALNHETNSITTNDTQSS